MSSEREEKIRRRAYAIWESEGRPEGREWDHWVQAAREIEAEEGGHAGDEGAEIPPMPEDFPQAEENSSGRSRRGRSKAAAASTPATSEEIGGASTKRSGSGAPKRPKKSA